MPTREQDLDVMCPFCPWPVWMCDCPPDIPANFPPIPEECPND